MIQVEGIYKSYGERCLLSNVSFHVGEGERCAIVGRNGSGKSTLLKIISGLELPDTGTIVVPKGVKIGSLPQHLVFNSPTLVEEAVLGLPEDLREEPYRVEILLSGLGFSKADFSAPPGSFSGGYQLRLALCKVLAGQPDLLLLDEPTNYLDILSIRWLEHFFRSWPGQMLFISHDRAFLNKVCTHVLGIKRSEVRKTLGNLEDYEHMMQVHEQTHESTRLRLEKKKEDMMDFVRRFGAKATKASQAQSRLKAIEKMESMEVLGQEQDLSFRFNHKPSHSRRVLLAEKLTFNYPEQPTLIRDVSFELERGQRLAIVGKNGSGKSTLLRLLLGDLIPQSGRVELGNQTQLAYFGQTNIDRLNLQHTIEQELMATFPQCPYGQIRAVCGAMLFSGDDAKKRISVLSGGEKSRVLLAKILLTPANLLLLDEPTHHLDMESVQALMEAIAQFEGSVVLISHDEFALQRFNPQKLIICHPDRQQVFWGNYEDFVQKEGWEEEKAFFKKTRSKEDKRDRAQRIQERSAALRPVKAKIEALESQIQSLEKEITQIDHLLGAAAADFKQMAGVAQQRAQSAQALENAYTELERLIKEEEIVLARYHDLDN